MLLGLVIYNLGYLVISSLLCFISYFFFQKAENNRLKKSQLTKILLFVFA